ncbi:MAG: hypothetical protein ACRDUX_40225 [Mycobacterium sp.]
MGEPFRGSEALANGDVSRHELRRLYRRLLPDVYIDKRQQPTLRDRTMAAWLWSKRKAVVAGAAASALHFAEWVDATTPIELIGDVKRPPRGLIVRNESSFADEVTTVAGISVTTVARTAFDLGRHGNRGEAIARLDALKRATGFRDVDVLALMTRHQGARGLAALRMALPLVDGGAMSPKETWLRLLLIDAGLPKPATQIRVIDDGRLVRTLDLCWEDYRVGAEYDGDQHRTDRLQYAKDVKVKRKLASMQWNVTYVIKEDRPDEIVASVRNALLARGWRAP